MKLKNFLKTLGPGILFASTAIGVSHLVQSTRSGANFGFALLWAVILANVLKYPFFEYGSRYANATETSIIAGYHKLGKWNLYLYLLILIISMFFVTSAVGAVTAGFLNNLFGLENLIPNASTYTTLGLFIVCIFILAKGRFSVLDGLIKVIGTVLLISTLIAFVLALKQGPTNVISSITPPDIWSDSSILFLIALMGWMPTAVDLSTWNSLWTVARIKQTGYKPKLKETLLDFNLGYWISALLSICFVTLGAYLFYGNAKGLPNSSAGFANEVVRMYTSTIGPWSNIFISAAAFSIMFGTCIAVFDGYARAMTETLKLIKEKSEKQNSRNYFLTLLLLGVVSFLIISFSGPKSFKTLVDIATIVSFLIAPVIAIFNFKLVSKKHVGEENSPSLFMKILSYLGIIYLLGFCIFFFYKFF